MGKLKRRIKEAQRERSRVERDAGLKWDWWCEFLPKTVPGYWRHLQTVADGIVLERLKENSQPMRVVWSASLEADGRRWIHVSCSYINKLPSFEDLREVKDTLIGPDKQAFQVFPEQSKYVNIHPFCLHLWSCIDKLDIPDFTGGTGSI